MATMNVAASNFLIPNGTFIVEVIAFVLILLVLAKWVIPPINKALTERQEGIRRQFEEGEEAKAQAQQAEQEFRSQIAGAREEGARIREEAREQGAAILAEMRENAQAEAQRIVDHARTQIQAEREQVVRQLRHEVGSLSVDLAGRIIGEALTDDARQRAVVDRFLTELEGGNLGAAGGGRANGQEPAGQQPVGQESSR